MPSTCLTSSTALQGVSSYSNLTDEERQSLLEKYRDVNVDDTYWTECIQEDLKEDLYKIGFDLDHLYWTGFWSQGDGACFTGNVWDSKKFLHAVGEGKYPWVHKLVEAGGEFALRVTRTGQHYHENSVSIDMDVATFWDVLEVNYTDGLRGAVVEAYDNALELELSDFEEAAISLLKDKMRAVYRQLEETYDELTSDEAVWDTIVANEYT